MVLKRREGGPGGRVASAGRGGCGGVNLEAPLPQRVLLNGRNLGLANSRSCSVQHAIVQRFSIFFHTKCCRTPRLRAALSLVNLFSCGVPCLVNLLFLALPGSGKNQGRSLSGGLD